MSVDATSCWWSALRVEDALAQRPGAALAGDCIVLQCDDCAPPFDLRQHLHAARPGLSADAKRREPGGLGLHPVLQMAQSLDYSDTNGENRLRAVLLRQG